MIKADLTGKTALITGAGGAIGAVIAKVLAENGAAVAVCDINIKAAEAVAEQIRTSGGKAGAYILDVTSSDSAADALLKIEEELGAVNILINNAGVNVSPEFRQPIHKFNDEKWDWILSIDLEGVYKCTKAITPAIIKNGGGSIINISSVVGQVPFRNQCAFTAAKAGVINLSKAMALELAPDEIRVNVICPGSIMMEGTKALFYSDPVKAEAMMSHVPMHRPGTPEDIAYATLFLASDASAYMTGSVMTIDGGWTCGYARDF